MITPFAIAYAAPEKTAISIRISFDIPHLTMLEPGMLFPIIVDGIHISKFSHPTVSLKQKSAFADTSQTRRVRAYS